VQRGSWAGHLKTKNHHMNIYVEQPNNDGEFGECVTCNLLLLQSSPSNDYICITCATASITPKMHCDICSCYVMPISWCGHIKTKKHLNNMSS
jgi:hypothetical protein